jgi:hypothetical protein
MVLYTQITNSNYIAQTNMKCESHITGGSESGGLAQHQGQGAVHVLDKEEEIEDRMRALGANWIIKPLQGFLSEPATQCICTSQLPN